MKPLLAVVAALVLVAPLARAEEGEQATTPPARARSGRFTYPGSVGFGIGDSTWGVSLRGEAGYLVTERLWTGVSGRFQWTHDERYSPTLDSVDYGVGAYARYFVFERFFASAEWDWTSYETTTDWGGLGREGERLELSRRGRLRPADRPPEPLPRRSALRRDGRNARSLRHAVGHALQLRHGLLSRRALPRLEGAGAHRRLPDSLHAGGTGYHQCTLEPLRGTGSPSG